MLKQRARQVGFRVTEEEYDALMATISERGARCLSDYVRHIVLEYGESQVPSQCAPSGTSEDSDHACLRALDGRVALLEAIITRLVNSAPGMWKAVNSGNLK